MAQTARVALALITALLLGSVLPADLFARLRGVDIRAVGDGNPGTVNAFRGLGLGLGSVTAAYDLSVGVVSIGIAHALGLSSGVAYLAGVMTVVGHRFPVFRGFRGGGQGMAASAGLLLYGLGVAYSSGWLSLLDLAGLVLIAVVTFVLTGSDVPVAMILLPVLVARLVVARPEWQFLAFMTAVAANIWIVQLITRPHALHIRLASALRGEPAEPRRGGTRG